MKNLNSWVIEYGSLSILLFPVLKPIVKNAPKGCGNVFTQVNPDRMVGDEDRFDSFELRFLERIRASKHLIVDQRIDFLLEPKLEGPRADMQYA